MAAHHAGRSGLSTASAVLLVPALALLGNLATNTVEVSWRWWPLTVWIVVVLLVVATVWVEVSRSRSGGADEPVSGEPVVVTPEFLDVDYVRDEVTGSLLPASGHLLRLIVECRVWDRVILRSLRPEIVRRDAIGPTCARSTRHSLGATSPPSSSRPRLAPTWCSPRTCARRPRTRRAGTGRWRSHTTRFTLTVSAH